MLLTEWTLQPAYCCQQRLSTEYRSGVHSKMRVVQERPFAGRVSVRKVQHLSHGVGYRHPVWAVTRELPENVNGMKGRVAIGKS